MSADAPKFTLTCKLQPATTGEKVQPRGGAGSTCLCPSVSVSVGVTDPVPAKPQVSHDVRKAVSPPELQPGSRQMSPIFRISVCRHRRWGAKLLRITGMIIQARLVLEDIFFHKALELQI